MTTLVEFVAAVCVILIVFTIMALVADWLETLDRGESAARGNDPVEEWYQRPNDK